MEGCVGRPPDATPAYPSRVLGVLVGSLRFVLGHGLQQRLGVGGLAGLEKLQGLGVSRVRCGAIAENLAKADPGNADWQRNLSVADDRVGDVQVALGHLPEALKSYQGSLAIRDRLAKADPGNAGWQRDLSVSDSKVGAFDRETMRLRGQ
jgi:hypothetical protein